MRSATVLAVGILVVHFAAGRALIEQRGATEHVTIEDRAGRITSDSYCDAQSGRYDHIVAFALELKRAAAANDRKGIAALMRYPLRVNVAPERGYEVGNEGALRAKFEDVFTPAVLRALRTLEPHDVFCRDGRSMLAGGTLWADADRAGTVRGAIVNR